MPSSPVGLYCVETPGDVRLAREAGGVPMLVSPDGVRGGDELRDGPALKDFLAEELTDPAVRGHYLAAKAEWLVARAVTKARRHAHMTQVELAKKMKTDQKAIWRLEAGQQNATVGMLWKVAQATGSDLRVELIPRHAK